MKVFDFNPDEYRDLYAEQEWVHIRGGVDPDFLAAIKEFTDNSFQSHLVEGKAIGGAKSQAAYEFPPEVDFPDHLFDVVADVAGLEREKMTLSERHIKSYDADAPADPDPHKDRLASQVSVGLSISIPEGSSLVLWPDAERDPNPSNVSAALKQRLRPEQEPRVALAGAREVVIHDRPGDVVMFAGSSIWHARRVGANVVNLYLKFNDFGSDPLGEDPNSVRLREGTLAALGNGPIEERRVLLSRRLDTVTREHVRPSWGEALLASVWDQPPLPLDEGQFALLQAIDGTKTVGELLAVGNGTDEAAIRRMAERGVLDLA